MDDVFEKVKELIVENLDVDASKIVPEARLREDLDADSMDTFELIYAIEEKMGVTIPDDKAGDFETVKDAVDYIRENLS